MTLARIRSRACIGVEAPEVIIEVHISKGLPGFIMVGLPETTVRESKDRVRSALINSGFEFPSKKITVNLAPADLPKEGGRFDLAIALGLLLASGQLSIKEAQIDEFEFLGELSLTGEIRAVKGSLPAAIAVHQSTRKLIAPTANASHLSLFSKASYIVADLNELVEALSGKRQLIPAPSFDSENTVCDQSERDLTDIIGQHHAKRALQISAAGGHNLLFMGPPGTGKTMLANRLLDLLPDLSIEEALEVASLSSLVDTQSKKNHNWRKRPYRNPHHSSSMAALVGGGSVPKPGEISLAHHGVLFLDEMTEFDKKVLDALREPLESNSITISRASSKAQFPAKFLLVGSLNPSPSGYYQTGDNRGNSAQQILKYLGKISGPLLDRFDMTVEVPLLPQGFLSKKEHDRGESTAIVKQKVQKARQCMIERQGFENSELNTQQIERYCHLCEDDMVFLEDVMVKLGLSIRAFHKIIKVARTIADLEQRDQIERKDLIEAISYRSMDRLLKKLNDSLS